MNASWLFRSPHFWIPPPIDTFVKKTTLSKKWRGWSFWSAPNQIRPNRQRHLRMNHLRTHRHQQQLRHEQRIWTRFKRSSINVNMFFHRKKCCLIERQQQQSNMKSHPTFLWRTKQLNSSNSGEITIDSCQDLPVWCDDIALCQQRQLLASRPFQSLASFNGNTDHHWHHRRWDTRCCSEKVI